MRTLSIAWSPAAAGSSLWLALSGTGRLGKIELGGGR